MAARFEEIDWQQTPIGEISLRRRVDPTTGREIHEVKLGDEYLMSSLFTAAEEELGRLAVTAVEGDGLAVVVGGLGLGFTAVAVLDDARVAELMVVDALAAVIGWHTAGHVPLGARLSTDPRCRLVEGDFFALAAGGTGFDGGPLRELDVIALDVDHSPRHVLAPANAELYTVAGLGRLARHLRPGGVFALWSNDPPDEPFLVDLRAVFDGAEAHVVEFPNPLQGRTSTNTVYLARR